MNYPIDYKKEQEKFYRQLYETSKTLKFEEWYSQIVLSNPLEQEDMFVISVNKCQWEVMRDSWITYDNENNIYQSWTGLPNTWIKVKKRF